MFDVKKLKYFQVKLIKEKSVIGRIIRAIFD